MRTGAEATAAWMASTRAGSSMRSSWCTTPSPSVTVASRSPGSRVRSARPAASDRPQIGDRLARVARVRSSRSVEAFGVVCSWGSTSLPGASGSVTARAPSTPAMVRGAPASSVNVMA